MEHHEVMHIHMPIKTGGGHFDTEKAAIEYARRISEETGIEYKSR